MKRLIDVLYASMLSDESQTRWIEQGASFEFPLTSTLIGRVVCIVREEGALIFIEVGVVLRSKFGEYAACVAQKLMEASGNQQTVLFHVILPSEQHPNDRLFGIKTLFDFNVAEADMHERYVPRFNSRCAAIKLYLEEFDGLLNELFENCKVEQP